MTQVCNEFNSELNICIYGLNRSLSQTIHSIRSYLLDPLKELGIASSIYACLIKTDQPIVNPRSGELDVYPEQNEQELLPNAVIRHVDQDTIDALIDWEPIFAAGDLFGDGSLESRGHPTGSLANCIRALSSLRAAFDLIPEEGLVHPVIFLRPDIDILSPIPIQSILASLSAQPQKSAYGLSQGVTVAPCWHRWDGVNDRFAVCSAGSAASSYASRLNYLDDYLRISGQPFHPESFLLHVLTMRHVQILPIVDTLMARVRCEGIVHSESFSDGNRQWLYPSAAWQSLTKLNQKLSAALADAEKNDNTLKIQELEKQLAEARAESSLLLEQLFMCQESLEHYYLLSGNIQSPQDSQSIDGAGVEGGVINANRSRLLSAI